MWHDEATGQRKKVRAGNGSPVRKLRHTHPTKPEAQRAADSELKRCKRGVTSLSLGLSAPLIAADSRLLTAGFRPGVDGLWSVKSVCQEIDGGGFTTEIEAEKPDI